MPEIFEILKTLSSNEVATYFCTSAMSFVFYVVLQAFQRSLLSRELWARYLSYFFLVLSVQYGFKYFGAVLDFNHFGAWATVIGSNVNNLFVLATAFALLYPKIEIETKDIRSSFFPIWVLILVTISAASSSSEIILKEVRWEYRFLDALISGIFLGYLGYALFLNLNGGKIIPSGRSKLLTTISLTVIASQFLYALFNLVYAFSWELSGNAFQQLDHFIFVVTLPLKLMLFVGGLIILIQSMTLTNSEEVRKILKKFRDQRSEFLVPGGVVDSIGKSLGVSRVRLLYFRPGKDTLFQLYWKSTHEEGRFNEIPRRVACKTVKEALKTGKVCVHQQSLTRQNSTGSIQGTQPEVIWAIPIIYHGGVIGCIAFVWDKKIQSTMPLLERLRHLADILAPAVHHSRQMLAIESIEQQFRRIESENKHQVLEVMAKILRRNLGVPALGIQMNIGFYPNGVLFLDECKDIWDGEKEWSEIDKKFKRINPNWACEVIPIRDPEREILWGTLYVGLGKIKDEADRPTLGSDWLFQKALVSLVANSYHELIRKRKLDLVSILQGKLYDGVAFAPKRWHESLEAVAHEAKALWLVSQAAGDDKVIGEAEHVQFVEHKLPKLTKRIRRWEKQKLDEVVVFDLEDPNFGLGSVLKLEYKGTKIWMGLARKMFGNELVNSWAWTVFLERFVIRAHDAIERLKLRQEKVRAIEYKSISTAAVVTSTLVHQIKNLAAGLGSTLGDMNEELAVLSQGKPRILSEQLAMMGSNIERLNSLTILITDIVKMEGVKPCCLRKVIDRAEELFEASLRAKKIRFENNVEPGMEIDCPFNVACLVIANLVGNSVDAMIENCSQSGVISVEAKIKNHFIYCCVVDNGPGVPEEIQNKIFEMDVSTKSGSNGVGLYLTRRAVEDEGGSIELEHSESGNTRICVSFPLPVKKDSSILSDEPTGAHRFCERKPA